MDRSSESDESESTRERSVSENPDTGIKRKIQVEEVELVEKKLLARRRMKNQSQSLDLYLNRMRLNQVSVKEMLYLHLVKM